MIYRVSAEEALRIYDVRLVLEPYLTSLAAAWMQTDALKADAAKWGWPTVIEHS